MKVLLFTVLIAGCGDNQYRSHPDVDASPIDGSTDGRPDAHVMLPDGPAGIGVWSNQQPIVLTPPPSSGIDNHPSMTNDLLELYFTRSGDIYFAKRTNLTAAFGAPMLISELSSASFETGPSITGDGLTMYFASDRAGGLGGFDIWIASRTARTLPFGAPTLVTELNTNTDDSSPAVTNDGLAIVLSSTRGGNGVHLYMATRSTTTSVWNTPVALDEINSMTNLDNNPALSDDKLTIYWDVSIGADRDLYVASRATTAATFGTPAPITELNTLSIETAPWVSSDSHHIVWLTNASGTYTFMEASR